MLGSATDLSKRKTPQVRMAEQGNRAPEFIIPGRPHFWTSGYVSLETPVSFLELGLLALYGADLSEEIRHDLITLFAHLSNFTDNA